jgi:hypothetical protein
MLQSMTRRPRNGASSLCVDPVNREPDPPANKTPGTTCDITAPVSLTSG